MHRRTFLTTAIAAALLPRAAFACGGTLNAIGDSFTCGCLGGASSQDKAYAYRVACARGMLLNDVAANGSEMPDIAAQAMPLKVGFDSQTFGIVGTVDSEHRGAAVIPVFSNILMATCAWLCIPEEQKIRGQAGAVTYAGSWTPIATYGDGLAMRTTTPGDTAMTRASGTTVYISVLRFADGSGAPVSVSVDGTMYGPYSTSDGYYSDHGARIAPMLIRIIGLSDGEHSVTVKSEGDGALFLLWVAGVKPSTWTRPYLWLGNCVRRTPALYAQSPVGNNDEVVAAYNAAILGTVNDLRADGLRLVHVDVSSIFDPFTDTVDPNDNIHPGDMGHAKIASAFLAQMP